MKAKRKVLDFNQWFRAQHGLRPGGAISDSEVDAIVRRGQMYATIQRLRLIWDEKRTSALYAWQIPDRDKP